MRLKGVFAWVIIILWLLSSIGGVGYTIYYHAWVIAPGVLANSVLAFFKVRDFYRESMKD